MITPEHSHLIDDLDENTAVLQLGQIAEGLHAHLGAVHLEMNWGAQEAAPTTQIPSSTVASCPRPLSPLGSLQPPPQHHHCVLPKRGARRLWWRGAASLRGCQCNTQTWKYQQTGKN